MFEIHLTFHPHHADRLRNGLPDPKPGDLLYVGKWKFSEIDGDPVLGKHKYCYLTAYAYTMRQAKDFIIEARQALIGMNITPVREKIEQIMYDTKSGIGGTF